MFSEIRALFLLVMLVALASCGDPKAGGPISPTEAPRPQLQPQPSTIEKPEPTTVTSSGTADGSGGDTQQSTYEEIDNVIFDSTEPQLSLKNHVKMVFYRLEQFQFVKNNKNSKVGPILYSMFNDSTVNILEDIEKIEFNVQDVECITDQKGHSTMAIKGHRVCISRKILSYIPPNELRRQMVALMTHEVAHLRGIESEAEANIVRDTVLRNSETLLIKNSEKSYYVGFSYPLSILAGLLPDFGDLLNEAPGSLKESRCYRLSYAIEQFAEVSSRFKYYSFFGFSFINFMKDLRKLLTEYCFKSDEGSNVFEKNSKNYGDVQSFWNAVVELINESETFRKEYLEKNT